MKTWITIATAVVAIQLGIAEEKPKADGLVAHYAFDEGSGTLVGDKSGNKNDDTIHGSAEWVKVGEGHALKFDGKTACVHRSKLKLVLQTTAKNTLGLN